MNMHMAMIIISIILQSIETFLMAHKLFYYLFYSSLSLIPFPCAPVIPSSAPLIENNTVIIMHNIFNACYSS